MNRKQALRAAGREVLDRSERKVVQPRFKGEGFRLLSSVVSVAQRARDGFVDDFLFSEGVGRDLFGSFAEVEFAFDKTLQAAETRVHVRANVFGGGRWDAHGRNCVFECNARLGAEIGDPTSLPLV